MKIVYIIDSLVLGGTETSLYDICYHINKEIHEITLIYFYNGNNNLETQFSKIKNLKIINFQCSSRYDIKILIKLIKTLIEIKPNIIHTNSPIASIYTRLSFTYFKSKLITTQHSVFYKKNIFHFIDRITAWLNDYYIANSNCTKEFLNKYYLIKKNKIKIIKLGIDPKKYILYKEKEQVCDELNIDPTKKKIIGHIGAFKKQKGHVYIIEAAKKIIEKNKDCIFILIGEGDLKENIQQEVIKNDLMNNFIFTGNKQDVASYLNIFDLFIFPSISESFGLSILEAMLFNVPVIAFNTDAIPELIENKEEGILVDKNDINDFVCKIEELLQNRKLAQRLSTNGHNKVIKEFLITKTVEKLENFYYEILNTEK